MSELAVDLRNLPAVAPVEIPDRFSQTLVVKSDNCPRSGYLYMKYSGGAPSAAMIRGTAAHLVFERATNLAIENEESQVPAEIVKDVIADVLREVPVPTSEIEYLREMAYHWAENTVLEPERIVAVERKILLPVGEHVVSMKIDLATASEDGSVCAVDDYKTARRLPAEDTVSTKLPDGRRVPTTAQLIVYALGAKYGFPVRKVPCGACASSEPLLAPEDCGICQGKRYVEERDPLPLAGRAELFNLAEVYPGPRPKDGSLAVREATVTAAEMPDHMAWLEGLVARLVESLGTWKFPAVDGTHCSECPARAECPLPAAVKNYRGRINTQAELSEAISAHYVAKAELAADWKEITAMLDRVGPTRFGGDQILEYGTQTRRSTDFDGLEEAVDRAVEFGEPFDLRDFIAESHSTPVKKRKLTAGELEEFEREPEPDLDERFGAEAPF